MRLLVLEHIYTTYQLIIYSILFILFPWGSYTLVLTYDCDDIMFIYSHRHSQDFCWGGGGTRSTPPSLASDSVVHNLKPPVVSTFTTSIRLLSSFFIKHCLLPPSYSLSFYPSISLFLGYRCHGLRVYAVCVCNKVRLPGTGQSAHVIVGSRFTRPASNSRRTLLNWDCWPQFNKTPIFAPTSNL